MPRGRNWYGPGFWKEPDWYPGAGGFRGDWPGRGPGWNPPGWGPGWGPGRGPCHWWFAGAAPYYGPAFSGPEEEKAFLKEQQDQLKAELNELEQRLDELEQES